jgi:putative transcriptional regulator
LDEELEDNSWIVCDFVTEELMFETEPTGMWRQALGNMGGRFSVYANYPVDPNLN